ncbi:MAG: hypothetical protein KGL22_03010 [Alphaproteobacteria bacterium]|nr:hypothetical protein [Alphaproteobacteria bacterium]
MPFSRPHLIDGQKRGVVWLDDRGVPIAFKLCEDGTPIEPVLTSPAVPLRQTAVRTR